MKATIPTFLVPIRSTTHHFWKEGKIGYTHNKTFITDNKKKKQRAQF